MNEDETTHLLANIQQRKTPRRNLIKGLTIGGISAGALAIVATPVVNAALNSKTAPQSHNQSPSGAPNFNIPANLQVPTGNILLFEAFGRGVQIYACPVTQATTPRPHAILTQDERIGSNLMAIHYAGPTWEAPDGSKVVGQKLASASPDPNSVPWLLLKAVSHEGNGVFSKVTYILRISTKGGLAPTNASAGVEVLAEYSAQYLFYIPQ